MSDYLHQKGYIYPLGKLSDEENDSIYKKIKGEENFKLDKDKFDLEYMGKNDYLIWLTYSTYGEKSDEFGLCRPCNQKEIYYHAPKFREILGEIDTKKLKFIDFCYYNSTECTVDYYLGEEEYKPMTLEQAIAHAKEVAASKCDECGKEHQQLAEWLTELENLRDTVDVLTEQGTIYEAHIKKYQKSLMDVWEAKKKAELKLASYEDKTLITEDFLVRNGFALHKVDGKPDHEFAPICRDRDYFLYCDDCVEISAEIRDEEVGIWSMEITFLDHGDTEELNICTLGQFRMFLAICGLDNIIEQFK